MTYEEFIERVKKQAHEELGYDLEYMKFMPKGYTSENPAEIEEIKDMNYKFVGETFTSLLDDFLILGASASGDSAGNNFQRLAIRQMYEDSKTDGFDAVFATIRESKRNLDDAQLDQNQLNIRAEGDYEKIKDHLIIRPLNYGLHMRDLKGSVYTRIADFTLVLYQVIGDGNHSLATSKIMKKELTSWGMEGQEERIMQEAMENTARLYPACVYDRRTQKEENFLEKDFTKADISFAGRRLLSTTKKTNGAVAIFYPGVREKLMKVMGGPFDIVFMNINDALIFEKGDREAYGFARTAKQSSPQGEMLSGKVYLCDETGIHAR